MLRVQDIVYVIIDVTFGGIHTSWLGVSPERTDCLPTTKLL